MKPSPLQIVSRVAAGLVGGYAFVWGFIALAIASHLLTGMPYGDARMLTYLLAFVVLLIAFCWAFAARNLTKVWLVLAGGGLLMTGLAWWLTHAPSGA